MKTPQQIQEEIAILEEKRKSEKELYKSMHQIFTAKTEGKITALKWVLR